MFADVLKGNVPKVKCDRFEGQLLYFIIIEVIIICQYYEYCYIYGVVVVVVFKLFVNAFLWIKGEII